jgi:hypothetical protein
MFAYMGVSLVIVADRVGNNRSCIVTCDANPKLLKKNE